MGLEQEIKQKRFKSEYAKASINVMYTNYWLLQQHLCIFKKHGLTAPQYNILRILRGQYPGFSTINMLIERMIDKSSNASRIVDKLEEKGLVLRKPCTQDRRAVHVFISPKGLTVLDGLDVELEMFEKKSNRLSQAECETLNVLLDKLRQP